jgi:hypothetical protein
MEHSIAEPFLTPVDVNVFPSYAMSIEYPMDLNTIKRRLENRFYRSVSVPKIIKLNLEISLKSQASDWPKWQLVISANHMLEI